VIQKIRKEYTEWQKVSVDEAENAYNSMTEDEFSKTYCLMGNTYYRMLHKTDEEIKLILLHKIHGKLQFFWIAAIVALSIYGIVLFYTLTTGR
jgi:hypothetical protein